MRWWLTMLARWRPGLLRTMPLPAVTNPMEIIVRATARTSAPAQNRRAVVAPSPIERSVAGVRSRVRAQSTFRHEFDPTPSREHAARALHACNFSVLASAGKGYQSMGWSLPAAEKTI